MLDFLRQKAYQRDLKSEQRSKDVKQTIIELTADGKNIDGLLAIYLKHGKIVVMQGGLNDDFEAGVMIRRAEYLINRDGLVR